MKQFILILFFSSIFSNVVELLKYEVYFNEIKAGKATLQLSKDANSEKYIINFDLKSYKYLDVIYKLRENTSMIINKNDYSIYEINKYTRQGRRKRNYHAIFDYDSRIAYINKKITTFQSPVYDPINIIYYIRNNFDLFTKDVSFSVLSKNQFKNISMKILAEEYLNFNDQQYDCVVVGPNNINKEKSLEDIKIWFTKDSLKLPLIIEKRAKLGKLKMELLSIEKYD